MPLPWTDEDLPELLRIWDNGSDVAINLDDGDTLLDDWPGTPFKAGDSKMEVWEWFDQRHPRGIAYMLYGDSA